MYNDKNILAIIPARGGSKGIHKKNIKLLLNKPLIEWTIEEAKQSKYIDRIIVSSEDDEILAVSQKYGSELPFKRPIELAQDDTPGVLPVLHAMYELPNYDYVVLLQPTSPLRTVVDIDKAIEQCIGNNENILVSVSESKKSPYWMYKLSEEQQLIPLFSDGLYTRRQDIPMTFETNGAIYISSVDWLKETKSFIHPETKGYIMSQEDSYDIDTPLDFFICEQLLKKRISNS